MLTFKRMAKADEQLRIKFIHQMLLELAIGNGKFRLSKSQYKDDIDELSEILNAFAEKLYSKILKYGYNSKAFSFQNISHFSLILSNELIIENCNADLKKINLDPELVIGTHLSDHLHNASQCQMKVHELHLLNLDELQTTDLIFRTRNNSLVPMFCSMSKLANGKIILTSVSTELDNYINQIQVLQKKYTLGVRPSENEIMQELYQYILENLDKPLPTLKQLAKLYKINEFDLKSGFRNCFHTSIHRFYNDQRLKRAHLMIVNTQVHLKSVAAANGFTNYTSFYKAFKQNFGYAPSMLERKNNDSDAVGQI